ncbi:MAG: thioredoxin-disulfide reductase [Clostridiales bacterium]|jgi:thioredoxin reductase (NADPH)|nr:thioredoxin-disulfide reductase [Clostridiales bacterium]
MLYDIIIIGGGCAGLTAAIYAARAGKEVLVFESDAVGGQISTSPKVENFPSIKQISGAEFSDNLLAQATSFGAKLIAEKVAEIKDGETKTVITSGGEYECKRLIIATGVKHRKLGADGEEDYEGKGVSYCAVCDGMFFRDADVAVIGGGDSAVITSLYLSNICKKVYHIHRRDEFRAESYRVNELKTKSNVELVLSSNISSFEGDDFLQAVIVENVNTKEQRKLEIDGLFISIGYSPDSEIFKDVIALDNEGYIIAGEDCKTSADGIYAAGDCRTKSLRQLTTAAADGSVAAVSASADI